MKTWSFILFTIFSVSVWSYSRAARANIKSSLGVLGDNVHAINCSYSVQQSNNETFQAVAIYIGSVESKNILVSMRATDKTPRVVDPGGKGALLSRGDFSGSPTDKYVQLAFATTTLADNNTVYICRVYVTRGKRVITGATASTVIRVLDPSEVVRMRAAPSALALSDKNMWGNTTISCGPTVPDSGLTLEEMTISRFLPLNGTTEYEKEIMVMYDPTTGATEFDKVLYTSYDKSGVLRFIMAGVTCKDVGQYTCDVIYTVPLGHGRKSSRMYVSDSDNLTVEVLSGRVSVSFSPSAAAVAFKSIVLVKCEDITSANNVTVELIWEYRESDQSPWLPIASPKPATRFITYDSCRTMWFSHVQHVVVWADTHREYRCYPRRSNKDYTLDGQIFSFQLMDDEGGGAIGSKGRIMERTRLPEMTGAEAQRQSEAWSSPSTGAIVGSVLAAIACIAFVLAGIIFKRRQIDTVNTEQHTLPTSPSAENNSTADSSGTSGATATANTSTATSNTNDTVDTEGSHSLSIPDSISLSISSIDKGDFRARVLRL